jgi:hypothetical protein
MLRTKSFSGEFLKKFKIKSDVLKKPTIKKNVGIKAKK